MSLKLAERVTALKPSASIAAKKKVTELQALGRNIIDLTLGEPDLNTPAHIVDAAYLAMRKGDTHYTATPGTPALRAAIVAKFQRENGLTYKPDEIVVGSGAKQLIFEAFAATLDVGDEVIVPAPYWVSYPDLAAFNGATPIIVTASENTGFKLRPEALEAAITPKTRWLVLNTPNNPTGAVYSREEIKALTQVLAQHPHVWLMTDDIYEHLLYDGNTHVNPVEVAPELASRSLIINGLSKAHAMTGWRVGYAAGPKPLIDAISKLLGQSTTCASSVSQAAAVAALNGDQTHVRDAAELYRQRRDRMIALLSDVPELRIVTPGGAFYLYVSVAGLIGRTTPAGLMIASDLDVSLYLLEAANVAVLDGAAYGLSPYLRISFATAMSAIEEGCGRIRQAIEALF